MTKGKNSLRPGDLSWSQQQKRSNERNFSTPSLHAITVDGRIMRTQTITGEVAVKRNEARMAAFDEKCKKDPSARFPGMWERVKT